MNWRDSVNQSIGVARIANIANYVINAPGDQKASIDAFYDVIQELLSVGSPNFLSAHPRLGPLLFLGLVSATENYFRDLYAALIEVCPLAQAKSAEQSVNLGSVLWHPPERIARSAFEHISFADSKQIISNCQKFLGYAMLPSTFLEEFDKICEIRHGIVHANAFLPGKNAIKLKIASSASPLLIQVGFAELQECGAICSGLVTNTNQILFGEFAKRWANVWPTYTNWVPRESSRVFHKMWKIFYSNVDLARKAIPYSINLANCRTEVLTEFS